MSRMNVNVGGFDDMLGAFEGQVRAGPRPVFWAHAIAAAHCRHGCASGYSYRLLNKEHAVRRHHARRNGRHVTGLCIVQENRALTRAIH